MSLFKTLQDEQENAQFSMVKRVVDRETEKAKELFSKGLYRRASNKYKVVSHVALSCQSFNQAFNCHDKNFGYFCLQAIQRIESCRPKDKDEKIQHQNLLLKLCLNLAVSLYKVRDMTFISDLFS